MKVAHPVRLRPVNPKDGNFEDLQVTTDAASESFSFTTTSTHYYLGMKLKVTLPYTASLKVERTGHVVRVQVRGQGYATIVVGLDKVSR